MPSVPREHSLSRLEEVVQEYGGDLVGSSAVEVVLAVVPRRRHKPPSSWTARSCCMGFVGCILSSVSCILSKTWLYASDQ